MKLKYKLEDVTDSFWDDAHLLGIMAPVKDYQFCRQINHCLRFDFRINHQIEIQVAKKQRSYFFSVFEYAEILRSVRLFLYNNQFDGEFLLPEFRHLDFLWLIKGELPSDGELGHLVETIRRVASVQLVTELTNEKIRNKEYLVL
jgi:hypothetical protein